MLLTKLLMLSVITAFALNGCNNNDTLTEKANTVVDSTEAPAQSESVIVLEKEAVSEVSPDLVHYTVSGGEYSEQCGFKDSEGKIVVKAEYG